MLAFDKNFRKDGKLFMPSFCEDNPRVVVIEFNLTCSSVNGEGYE